MKRVLPLLLFTASLLAQQPESGNARVDELIQQLAAPKVRLRDEAQQALSTMIGEESKMRAAMLTHPSEEARLRLKRLLKGFHDGLWRFEWQQPVAAGGVERGALRATANGALLANLYNRGIEIMDTRDFSTVRTLGRSTSGILTLRMLAYSADGKQMACSNQSGSILVEDEVGKRLLTLPPETRKIVNNVNGVQREVNQMVAPVAADFLPGSGSLLVLSAASVTLHQPGGTPPKRLILKQMFPEVTRNLIGQSMALSGDGKFAAVAIEITGPDDDAVAMISLPAMTMVWSSKFSVTPRWVAVNADGSEALVAMRERGVVRCDASTPMAITVSRSIDDLTSVAYAPDGKSAFITSGRANAPLRELALPSGDEIWTAPAAPTGFYNITLLGPDRMAVKTFDNRVVVWTKRRSLPAR